MVCGSGFHCSRLSLTFLNILYLAISFVLMGLAGYAKRAGIIASMPIIGGILAVGVFLFFVSILGIVATLKHHQVLLFFYVVILFLLFIIEFSVSISCLALSHTQQLAVIKSAWDKGSDDIKHMTMKALNCCGYNRENYEDYWATGNYCADNNILIPPKDPTAPYEFCKDKIEAKTDAAVEKTGAIALFFSFTEMFGVWLAIRYRNQRNPAGPDPRAFE